jgi:hypothetical protein
MGLKNLFCSWNWQSYSLGTAIVLCVLQCGSTAQGASSSATYTEITNFTKTNDIQTHLISQVPTGTFTTSNSFATPFTINVGQNYGESNLGTVTAVVDLSNVTDVYTLMNAYSPTPGATLGTLTFNFADGSSQVETLIAGASVRDFCQTVWANTLTAPNAENAFTFTNTRDGGGNGNVQTGIYGTYVVDEQDWSVGDSSTLLNVQLSTTSTYNLTSGGSGPGTPILLGLTVAQSVPEPASLGILLLGSIEIIGARRRRHSSVK